LIGSLIDATTYFRDHGANTIAPLSLFNCVVEQSISRGKQDEAARACLPFVMSESGPYASAATRRPELPLLFH